MMRWQHDDNLLGINYLSITLKLCALLAQNYVNDVLNLLRLLPGDDHSNRSCWAITARLFPLEPVNHWIFLFWSCLFFFFFDNWLCWGIVITVAEDKCSGRCFSWWISSGFEVTQELYILLCLACYVIWLEEVLEYFGICIHMYIRIANYIANTHMHTPTHPQSVSDWLFELLAPPPTGCFWQSLTMYLEMLPLEEKLTSQCDTS